MIIAAALCPSPPLLVPRLTGATQVAGDLRLACQAAVADLLAAAPDVVTVVGAAAQTRTWPAGQCLDVTAFAPGLDGAPERGAHDHGAPDHRAPDHGAHDHSAHDHGGLPASLGVGSWLLDEGGYRGERVLRSVAGDESVERCVSIGTHLAGGSVRTALLVVGDGSACRNPKAPGYFDERSASFDAEVERAFRTADLGALRRIDPGLATDLMATGRPGWQVLSGALNGHQVATQVRYCDDPFGVAYLVASLRVTPRRG